jgi:hypothetical protein
MVLSVDVKLDPKDGLEYTAGTELHESRGSEVCPAAAMGYGGCGGPGGCAHVLLLSPLDSILEACAMILRAKWHPTAPVFSNSLRRCRL